ncbi:B3/4 domain-containing protein [Dactylosporangium sucinum]|nr:phenylalanine--tRNA ligase beta subunit-related protein [Dactylosporangium sucinum]
MFAIADDVLDLCRSVGHEATVLAVLADGLRNGPGDGSALRDAVAAAGDLTAPHPHLEAWRDVYRAFGAKPQRTPCSAEALRRRAARGDLPSVNRLVDAYNAVSIRFAVPIGGEDRSALVGTERLVRASGRSLDEPFDTVKDGVAVVEAPEPGEVVWRDDVGVTCRRWNWRQGRRTALTDATTSAVFLLEGLDVDLTPAASMLCELLEADSVRIERLT